MTNTIKEIQQSKEFYDYILWGAIATVLNVVIFQVLIIVGLDYRMGNSITLITVRIFCYVTNKICVFHTKCKNKKDLIKEMLSFIVTRTTTLLLDYFMVIFLIEIIRLGLLISKMVSAFVVIVTNYAFSKKIFGRTKEKGNLNGE